MKKTALIAVGIILGSSMLFGVEAFAVDYNSTGLIEFEAGNGELPVDPTDPEKPVTPIDPLDPDKPIDPGTGGPLSIDFASNFQFNKQKISSKDEVYQAKAQSFSDANDGPNYVQVTDARGTGDGWSLSCKQNGQFKTEGGAVLEGAALTLSKGMVISTTDIDYTPKTVVKKYTLNPEGTTVPLVVAEKEQGYGTWIYKFGETADDAKESTDEEGKRVPGAVELSVPGKAIQLKEAYTTTLTWSLSSIPENS